MEKENGINKVKKVPAIVVNPNNNLNQLNSFSLISLPSLNNQKLFHSLNVPTPAANKYNTTFEPSSLAQ